jgi:hypothetical protein
MSPTRATDTLTLQRIAPLIHEIRGERVILDSDLAQIYGVETRSLVQAVKRNESRFPPDFAFRLSKDEHQSLRSQIVISNEPSSNRSQFATSKGRGGRRYAPVAFTEHGAIMAANVLNSKQAVEMSVIVVRAFVKLRDTLATHKELAAKIDELDRKFGSHDKAIASIIAAIRQLTASPVRKSPAIGFRAKRDGEKGPGSKLATHHARKK